MKWYHHRLIQKPHHHHCPYQLYQSQWKRHACLNRVSTPHDIYQTQVWNRRRQLWHCDHQQWHRGGLQRVSGFSESAIPKLDLDTEAMFNFRLWNQIEYFIKSTKAFRPPKHWHNTYHVNHDLMFFSLKPINISPWNYVWSEKILKAFLSDFSDSVDGLWYFAELILYHLKILE